MAALVATICNVKKNRWVGARHRYPSPNGLTTIAEQQGEIAASTLNRHICEINYNRTELVKQGTILIHSVTKCVILCSGHETCHLGLDSNLNSGMDSVSSMGSDLSSGLVQP